jgi:curli production assembly/transport component CsgG
MNYKRKFNGIILISSLLLLFSGCSFVMEQPLQTKPPTVGRETEAGERLKKLPKPKDKVVAAVYSFRDKTGQYKMSSRGGGSWSTAVTQGASSILIEAMENSEWFVPIERTGLGNLLNERKIIRSSRAAYNKGSSKNKLPPLMFAGIMLEGGIISYDHNVKTGGAGLRYFGAGASGQYRQDRVTVYLRAVSTKNGKVLESVNSTKTVLSQKIDAGVFRYVKFKRLLEAETGVTYNEPTHLALKSAIEKALEGLIIEGVFDDLWKLKNPEAINSDIIQSYVKEKEEKQKTERFGMKNMIRPYSFTVGVSGGITRYSGDFRSPVSRPLGNLNVRYHLTEHVAPFVKGGSTYLAAKPYYNKAFTNISLGTRYIFKPRKVYNPFVFGEFGAFTESSVSFTNVMPKQYNMNSMFFHSAVGGGIKYYLDEARRLGIEASLKFNYFYSDQVDGIGNSLYNDFFWQGNIGISYAF